MNKIIQVDLHIHTLASGHAYSTLLESVKVASERGIEGIALMDHGPALPGGAHLYYFSNLISLPRVIDGVYVFRGAEANIINEKGDVDIPHEMFEYLDMVAVAFHPSCGYEDEGSVKNTETLLKALEKYDFFLIAHPDNLAYPLEIEPVIEAAKEKRVLLELNNASIANSSARKGSIEVNKEYIQKFAENEVFIAVNSDAHFALSVGQCGEALSLLSSLNFPSNLMINASLEKVLAYIEGGE